MANIQGIFCPSLGAEFRWGPMETSHFLSQHYVRFSQIKKSKKKKNFFFFFFFFFLETTSTYEKQWPISQWYLCLSGMLGIIQSKITWFWGYISTLVMFYAINFSQFWCCRSFFPNFGQGPFPKIAGKALIYWFSWPLVACHWHQSSFIMYHLRYFTELDYKINISRRQVHEMGHSRLKPVYSTPDTSSNLWILDFTCIAGLLP